MIEIQIKGDPPNDIESEAILIGALLLNANNLNLELLGVTEAHFYNNIHKEFLRAIFELKKENIFIDILSVFNWLKSNSKAFYDDMLIDLNHLSTHTYISHTNVFVRLKLIVDRLWILSLKREFIENQIKSIAEFSDKDFGEVLDESVSKIKIIEQKISDNNHDDDVLVSFKKSVDGLIEYMDQEERGLVDPGVQTGFIDLDNRIGGFSKGDLILIAARPSMGKTSFATGVALNVARSGKKVLFFSLEMSNQQVTARSFSSIANVDHKAIKESRFRTDGDWGKIVRSIQNGDADLPLFFVEKSGVSVHEIRAITKRYNEKHNFDLVVIDYIGLIKLNPAIKNKSDQIGEVSWALKDLAKELNIPVVALSQLNRDSEKSLDKRPQLGNLRDSGSLEQDAALVIMLHREEYYKPDDARFKGQAELLIRKNRHGETGTVFIEFDSKTVSFKNKTKGCYDE